MNEAVVKNNAQIVKEPGMAEWLAFGSMVFGMFMAVLDIQIVASSLKEIQAGLSATQDEINWVQTSYLIAEVMIIPISGWLAKALSTRVVFTAACVGFTAMSAACAISWDLNSIIAFRALQGFFGGAMIPTVFASIYALFPMRMLPKVTVAIGLVVTVAPISGPIVGGYITENLSWHYLFLMNIIPGILVSISVWKFVKFDRADYSLLKNIDFIGIGFIMISLASLQYVLEEGVRNDWFDSLEIKVVSIISLLGFIALIYRELTTKYPVIDLRAFRNRNFAISCALSFILGWGLYTSVFILPVFLGSIKGLNSIQIGQYLCVMGAFQLLSAPVAGTLSKKMDLRALLICGFVMFAFGCYLNANMTYDSGFAEFFVSQAFRGFSLMFCFVPITSLALGTLPKSEIQLASGLYNLMRNLGGAVGLAVSNTWLQNWTKAHYLRFREKIDYTDSSVNDSLSFFSQNLESYNYVDPTRASVEMLYRLAQREAYIKTFNEVFLCMAALFCFALIISPLLKKVDPNAGSNNTGH